MGSRTHMPLTTKLDTDSRVDQFHAQQCFTQSFVAMGDLAISLAIWQLEILVCLLSITI